MIKIEVKRGGTVVFDGVCTASECTLGRDAGNFAVLKGWAVGRKQLRFFLKNYEVHLEDKGGLAAIQVNGTAVNAFGPLKAVDEIQIGDYRIHATYAFDEAKKRHLSLVESGGPEPVTTELAEVPAANVVALEPAAAGKPSPNAVDAVDQPAPEYAELETEEGLALRQRIHRRLIDVMDLRRVNVARMDDGELRETVRKLIDEIIDGDAVFQSFRGSRQLLRDSVLNEVVGLGPLEDLIADVTVTEIMVNRADEIFIEKKGKLQRSTITFTNDGAVYAAIERIVAPLGRRIDESSPMVDARLKDGSRVNAIIPPLALKGPSLTIRKFSKHRLVVSDLIGFGTVTGPMAAFLKLAVEQRANIVISGGTGSGKTTLLNVLSNFIPQNERIVTVEDAAELQLNQPNLVSLEARPANVEGKGHIAIRDLVKNCLRMRPDRIVVGECRSGEALDMLQAMNTGHDGSMTTAHANTPRDCLARLEVMTMMSGLDIPATAIREQIASAINIIVQQTRFSCGSRKITHVSEVTGMEMNTIQLQDIFVFKQDGFDENGKVAGRFEATGHIPEFYQALMARGIKVDVSIFGLPPERETIMRSA